MKPARPPSALIWGCGAARAQLLRGLERAVEPGAYFDAVCRRQPVKGVRMSDVWVDIGTVEALEEALGGTSGGPARPPKTPTSG